MPRLVEENVRPMSHLASHAIARAASLACMEQAQLEAMFQWRPGSVSRDDMQQIIQLGLAVC